MEIFQGALCSILLICLIDRSYAVRIEAASLFSKCCILFGIEWVLDNLFPTLTKYSQHSSYLNRQATLFALESLVQFSSIEIVEKHHLPILNLLVKDKVPNVRYCVVKLVRDLGHLIEQQQSKENCSSLKILLNDIQIQLLSDSDPDVRDEAEKLLIEEEQVK